MAELGEGDGRSRRGDKAPGAFRTISEVAADLDVPQHVLRFWESKFSQIRPLKRGGGRRYYRPEDVDLLRGIRRLLYADGYTIRGVQKLLREQGARSVAAAEPPGPAPAQPASSVDRRRTAVARALAELGQLRELLRSRRS